MTRAAEPAAARFGPYRLLRVLDGRLARTHHAVDTRDRTEVVLKRLRATTSDETARFADEIEALHRLRHRGIPRLHEAGRHDEEPFLALRYIPGASAGALFDAMGRVGERLEPPALVALGLDTARALAAAHEAGLLHRDLSPDNVLIGFDGSSYITDLGLAQFRGKRAATLPGALAGTPGFLAPERLQGGAATTASDVYALAAVLWLLAAERPLDPTRNDEARLARLPEPLRNALKRAVAPIQERTPTAQAFAEELATLATIGGEDAGRTQLATLVSALFAAERGPRVAKGRRRWVAPVALAIGLGCGGWWITRTPSPPSSTQSNANALSSPSSPSPSLSPSPPPSPSPSPPPSPSPSPPPSPSPSPPPSPSPSPSPPPSPSPSLSRGLALLRSGDLDALDRYADTLSSPALADLLRAESSMQRGEPGRALQLAAPALSDASLTDRAHRLSARALVQLGRSSEAARHYHWLLRRHPHDPELSEALRALDER